MAALRDFPSGPVQGLEILGNFLDVLDGPVGGNQLVLHPLIPEAQLGQVAEEVLVDHDELTAECAPGVDVGGVGLEALVVAEDLRGGGRGHGRDEQAVAHALFHDFLLENVPLPPVAWLDAPQVELELCLRTRESP